MKKEQVFVSKEKVLKATNYLNLEELTDIKKKGVWEIINKNSIPKDWSLIQNKWVSKQTKNSIYQARLVALGYSQVPGGRMILVLKMANDWLGETIDVETACLYGNLTEEIYMTIPNGLKAYLNQQLSGKCVNLKK